MKEKCLKVLEDKFHLHLLHKLAMFLHPKLKSLRLLSHEADTTGVHNEARRPIKLISLIEQRRDTSSGPSTMALIQAKRPHLSGDHLSEVEDSSDDSELNEDEVSAYIQLKPPKVDSFNVLLWWKEHQEDFPNLATIAQCVLSIPASALLVREIFPPLDL
ncbi:uncharacterized protein V6R79_004120 [Siganus canaliculatus]